jgi:hypothetical protein
MKRLLAWLRTYSLLPAVPGDVPSPSAPEPTAAGGGEPDPAAEASGELDFDIPAEEPTAPAAPSTEDRLAQLERELADERRARASQPASAPAPAYVPPQQDPDYQREEEQLARARATGNEDTMRWAQWEVQTNRTLRANTLASNRALAEAQDTRDQAQFTQFSLNNPQLAKRYSDKVEAAVAEMKAKGQTPPPRSVLLRLMVGDDIVNGKGKPKSAPAPAPSVPRGKMPPARTDVSGRGGSQSEREKRRERLRNQFV